MTIKKIEGTRSTVEIEFDDYIAILDGDMLVGGFAAFKSSLKVYDASRKQVYPDQNTINELFSESVKKAQKTNFNLVFD